MQTLFVACLLVGAAVLALQIVLSFVGLDTDASGIDAPHLDAPALDAGAVDMGHADAGAFHAGDPAAGHGAGAHGGALEGLDLLTVRSLSAGIAMYGAAGLGLSSLMAPVLAALAAVAPGFAAAAGTAWLTRALMAVESDGSLRLDGAVGRDATVYLTVPGASLGSEAGPERSGLVHVSLQGRTVELRAVTREGLDLPTGSPVVVIAVGEDGETVEVVPPSILEDTVP